MRDAVVDEGEKKANAFVEHEADDEHEDLESTSLTASMNSPDATDATEKHAGIADRENDAVVRSKWLVYIVLLAAAATVGTITYFVAKSAEEQDFQISLHSFAQDIAELVSSNSNLKFAILRSFSASVTAYELEETNNKTWPFVTIPHFQHKTAEALNISGAKLLFLTPIVQAYERDAWTQYASENQEWIRKGLDDLGFHGHDPGSIPSKIHFRNGSAASLDPVGRTLDFFLPLWEMGLTPANASVVNLDMGSISTFELAAAAVYEKRSGLLSGMDDLSFLRPLKAETMSGQPLMRGISTKEPHSFVVAPVFDSFAEDSRVVAFLTGVVPWTSYFQGALANDVKGLLVYLKDSCGSQFTFRLDGSTGSLVGEGDLHEEWFKDLNQFVYDLKQDGVCQYTLEVYPSAEFRASYSTKAPMYYTIVVVCVFLFTTLVFLLFDLNVQRRQTVVKSSAMKTMAIVSSLFPSNVQERLMSDQHSGDGEHREVAADGKWSFTRHGQMNDLLRKSHGVSSQSLSTAEDAEPICDFFPSASVLFADIAGFTAWSSIREPREVFILLQAVYGQFDMLAQRRGVYKIETIGDCYVATCGLPTARKDHAVVMARFATDCLFAMNGACEGLEERLGPDTSDLAMRIGLHCGPVTAGVLRGSRARFQLFGDTVNTTSRIETTGQKGRIHASLDFANELSTAGKAHWLTAREDKVVAKGKGELSTFWVHVKSRSGISGSSCADETPSFARSLDCDESSSRDVISEDPIVSPDNSTGSASGDRSKTRFVQYNAALLARYLSMLDGHQAIEGKPKRNSSPSLSDLEEQSVTKGSVHPDPAVSMNFQADALNAAVPGQQANPNTVLGEAVMTELLAYVTAIASAYTKSGSFYTFERSSHVVMSVVRFLTQMEVHETSNHNGLTSASAHTATDKNDTRPGDSLVLDPLAQFALVLAGLTHAVAYPQEPRSANATNSGNATGSFIVAWNLLMNMRFSNFRRCIYKSNSDFLRFRQTLMTAVTACDVCNLGLNVTRAARWDELFQSHQPGASASPASGQDNRAKKALIAEYMMQAAAMAHTMQHWQIFLKWQERRFVEQKRAFLSGSATDSRDPVEWWYDFELELFSKCVVPLASKLHESGAFGFMGLEYVKNAQQNQEKWQQEGQALVKELAEKYMRISV